MTFTILLVDTETNGLPRNRYAPISEIGAYPAILQLSWAIYAVEEGKLIRKEGRDVGIALDPSIPWDTGAAKIHKLSEVEARHGTPARTALHELRAALYSVDMVVAHNLAFDKSVIRAAGYRAASLCEDDSNLRSIWNTHAKEFCTMLHTRDILQIPASAAQAKYKDLGPYKSPKLGELYEWCYGHLFRAELHSAKSDTDCLAQCVDALLQKGLFPSSSPCYTK
jgi:DNA polymerase III epsilon subunit-like protein